MKRVRHGIAGLALAALLGCETSRVNDVASPVSPPTTPGAVRWWKGNLHTHTLWSDGDDFPEMVADWYRERGYHFLALSDHNVLARGVRWMPEAELVKRGGADVLTRRCAARFGAAWVERRGAGDAAEVRLKPLDEFRALVEERGRFFLIPAEEISDVVYDADRRVLRVKVQPKEGATYTVQFIGSLAGVDTRGEPLEPALNPAGAATERDRHRHRYSDRIGAVLATVEGVEAEYRLTGSELYVRAVVTPSQPPADPVWEGQKQQAWTQPVGWEVRSGVE